MFNFSSKKVYKIGHGLHSNNHNHPSCKNRLSNPQNFKGSIFDKKIKKYISDQFKKYCVQATQ
jgi:hypothetical protein